MRRLTTEELERIVGLDRTDPDTVSAEGRQVADEVLAAIRVGSKRENGRLVSNLLRDPERLSAVAGLAKYAPEYWSAALAELREAEISQRTIRDLEAKIRALVKAGDRLDVPEHSSGLPKGFQPAEGYSVSDGGVWRSRGEEAPPELVCSHHLTARAIVTDTETEERWAEVVWPRGSVRLPLAELGSGASVAATLGGAGAAVHADNARPVARYLSESLWASGGSLPLIRTSGRLGWFPDGFLHGDRWLGDQARKIQFSGPEELVRATEKRGTARRWREALEAVGHRPAAWIAVWSSAASPLLSWLGLTSGFIVDFSGQTSRGKTSILRLAASVWGRPDQSGLLRSWDATTNYLEAYAAQLQNLPVLLDDTKQSKRKGQIAGVLYSHSYGQSKGRARPGRGAQSVDTRNSLRWLSILISTGEARITSYSEDEGARARCLCYEGAPLGSGEEAWSLSEALADHYGHAGPILLESITGQAEHYRSRWKALRDFWRAELASEGGAVAGRLGELLGLLALVREAFQGAGLPMPPEGCDPLGEAARFALAGAEDAERAVIALDDLRSYVLSRPAQVYGLAAAEEYRKGSAPWLAKVDRDGRLCIVQTFARSWLRDHGHDPQAALTRWESAGLAALNRKLQLSGSVVTMIRLRDPL